MKGKDSPEVKESIGTLGGILLKVSKKKKKKEEGPNVGPSKNTWPSKTARRRLSVLESLDGGKDARKV